MITRTVRVGSFEEIEIHINEVYGDNGERFTAQAIKSLKKVLLSQPTTALWERTPLATARRYDYYVRKDGKRKKIAHKSGSIGALRNAVRKDPVRDAGRHSVTFGAHATATLDYAPYVHEAVKPAEGEYWSMGMPGRGHGWTTQGTGNRFVTRSVEAHADWIPEKLTQQMDKDLSGRKA